MLDGGIIQRLLEEKWKTFARVNIHGRIELFENTVSNQLNFLSSTFSITESIFEAPSHSLHSSVLLVHLCVPPASY